MQEARVDTSFGGIKERGVKHALEMAYKTMENGATWYIRSDIEGFFTKIQREKVLTKVSECISDEVFNVLLKSAVTTELVNMDSLGALADLFPIYEIGVAQGCCLSPLIGNILLAEFDKEMNKDGITCLRYIDDFLLLGPSKKRVVAAFKKAQKLLRGLGLTAYDPAIDDKKAAIGETSKGFDFLGCEVLRGYIRPNKKSRTRVLDSIDQVFRQSEQLMSDPKKLDREGRSLIEAMAEVNHILKGWGNQYSYCNESQIINQLDEKRDEKIRRYLAGYSKKCKSSGCEDRRRILGVHLLVDSKSEPILKSKKNKLAGYLPGFSWGHGFFPGT